MKKINAAKIKPYYDGSTNYGAVAMAFSPALLYVVQSMTSTMIFLSLGTILILLLCLGNVQSTDYGHIDKEALDAIDLSSCAATFPHVMSGITLSTWFELLWNRWRNLDWGEYWIRILIISITSCVNSVVALFEHLIYGHRVATTELPKKPVFILGHPRTGTTHLHNLLSMDSESFQFPSSLHCTFPSSSILTSSCGILSRIRFMKRPMDNVSIRTDSPQEEEIGNLHASRFCSPYVPMILMSCQKEFRRFFNFDEATEEETYNWIFGLMYLLKKVTFYNEYLCRNEQKKRRLLIKSPPHVSRARLLLQLFPDAEFIFIHRHPYAVWNSALNMARTLYHNFYLANPSKENVVDYILSQYKLLFEDYLKAKEAIPSSQFFELSYNELTADTMGSIEKIYEYFDWDNWDTMQPVLEKYLESLTSYKKNKLKPLPPLVQELVYQHWKPSFDKFGYSVEQGSSDQQ